ncbi:reverse transcriptase/maturase family protein [Pseudoalteromonas sp. MMG005]|uniref:reverse transcriptase/maturase family protein n=1 Tax=Pseudoalteromonas sp. MMG005 TaxID=2822682 RepID=UPI001B3A5CF2|nr:reverse transcriptase/maturase family protein [Pseudoalteromonas sp. MMG005]MBQ4845130.1 group II intron reverse transcriptase domain-containing protein [Pseudoalteromonas sp. MMG005]
MGGGLRSAHNSARNDEHLLLQIASDDILQQAYDWLRHARKDSHHNNSVWDVRFHWTTLKPLLQQQLLRGEYRFSPCKVCHLDGEQMAVWHAQDALVLKALSLVLSAYLSPKRSPYCSHLAGNGGIKKYVGALSHHVGDHRFVCRSDVNAYYATIDHQILLRQINSLIHNADRDGQVQRLIANMLATLHNVNGALHEPSIGENEGNPLAPLLGAIYLHALDTALSNYCQHRGLRYYRYMDDWIILCKTRHQLRAVVKLMNTSLQAVKQTKHPYKTYIGRCKDAAFDFVGYRITPTPENNLTLAWKTWVNHFNKLKQPYERGTHFAGIA